MHTLTWVVGGLVALGIFVLAAVMLGRRVADGARVFIWPWLAASVVNMLLRRLLGQHALQRRDPRAGDRVRRACGGGLVCREEVSRRVRGQTLLTRTSQ